MTNDEVKNEIEEANSEALLADGFDDALVGYCERCGMAPVAIYDYDKCIDILMKRDGMDQAEAVEFFEFNTVQAFVGDGTPVFAKILRTFLLEAPGKGQ